MPRDMDVARREDRSFGLLGPGGSPIAVAQECTNEKARAFNAFGFGRRFLEQPGRNVLGTSSLRGDWAWAPDVEVFHRDSELVVRADLPGLTKNDVKVDVAEDRLTIQGERK